MKTDNKAQASASSKVPKNWMHNILIAFTSAVEPFDDVFDEDDLYDSRGYMIPDSEWDGVVDSMKASGYKVKRLGSTTYEIADKKYPGRGLIAEHKVGRYAVTVMEPDMNSESSAVEIVLHDFVATAASPSKKVKKVKKSAELSPTDKKFKELFDKLTACDKERDKLVSAFQSDATKLFSAFDKSMAALQTKAIKIGTEIDDLATDEDVELLESQDEQVHNWMMDGSGGNLSARDYLPKALLNPQRVGKRR